jgi:hypothetical protein
MRILYHVEEKFVIAVLLPKEFKPAIARTNLAEISHIFAEKYAPYLEAGQLANTTVFDDFAAEIETQFDTKAKCYIQYRQQKRAQRQAERVKRQAGRAERDERREKMENFYDQFKAMMDERHKHHYRVACRQERDK